MNKMRIQLLLGVSGDVTSTLARFDSPTEAVCLRLCQAGEPALRIDSGAARIAPVRVRALVALLAIVGAVISALAAEPVAAGTASQWWATLAFANRDLGVVVEGSGVEQTVARCELSVYATSNGGVSWAPPVVLSHAASCNAGGPTDELAITAVGSWFLATPQGLFEGRVRHPGFDLVPASRLTPSEPADAVCSVAAAGRSVFVVLAESCGLRDAVVLVVSGDGGSTWTRSTRMPLGSAVEADLVAPPDSLVAARPASAWLIGWRTPPSSAKPVAGPLDVTRTADGGRTWHTSTLPCRGFFDGLLTAAGNDLAALCLGEAMAGYQAMEVVTSTNNGVTWTQRCDNGPPGLRRIVGACPDAGYPSAIVAMSSGALVMALGYPIGGVAASLDGGRTWKLVLRSAATFLTLSQGTGTVWMLGIGPVSSGLRLAESADGRRWHAVALPRLG
jgi:photosystem II stability/assembly factor-like uncharacterized protein